MCLQPVNARDANQVSRGQGIRLRLWNEEHAGSTATALHRQAPHATSERGAGGVRSPGYFVVPAPGSLRPLREIEQPLRIRRVVRAGGGIFEYEADGGERLGALAVVRDAFVADV